MSRIAARIATVLVVGTTAFGVAACGSAENSVDQSSLESGMVSVGNQTADVASASCPEDVSSDEGTEFECTVTNAKGQEVPVTATIVSEGDEDVQFEVQTVDGVDITK